MLVLILGCSTINRYQRAETLPAGRTEVVVEGNVLAIPYGGGAGLVPGASVSIRHGTTGRLDLNARMSDVELPWSIVYSLHRSTLRSFGYRFCSDSGYPMGGRWSLALV